MAMGEAGESIGDGKPFALALIFTGHMVDLPDRPSPRFPPAMEELAASAIRRRVMAARSKAGGPVVGIASAARGGDILFLEACGSLGIELRVVLPFARARFLESSVGVIGECDWNARFDRLWRAVPPAHRTILRSRAGRNPYEHCNLHMLALARTLADGARLIALWDGEDKRPLPGGTASFFAQMRLADGQISHIDSRKLLRKLSARRAGQG